MKSILTVRRLIWPAALILLAVWILPRCTAMVPSPHGEIASGSAVRMYTQFPVYDKSIDRIQVILDNGGETNLEYGTEWAVEKKQGDAWVQVPFIPNSAWTQPLLVLAPGGTDSYYVHTSMLDHTLRDGQYRVVKEVSGTVYGAEFTIGASDVSEDAPFGYVPLEELPEGYSTENAAEDGVVVYHCTDDTFENAERIPAFLENVIRGVDDQIRFAFYSSNTPDKVLLTEVTFTGGSPTRFQHRFDFTRQQPDTTIQTRYFSYLTTHNDKLFCLANAGNTTRLSDDSCMQLSPMSENWEGKEEWMKRITEYASSRMSPVSAWSPDGLRHVWASPDDVLTFFVNIQYPEGDSMGYTADLLSEKIPQSVKEFVWIDETTLFIVCSTNEDGLEYFATYDTDKQKITHWSTGKNGYSWEDGAIVIPD